VDVTRFTPPRREAVEHIVDNRVFLLGLDQLYRDRMQHHERTELLACARAVAGRLNVTPADVPIEGYYAESKALVEYFGLVRRLQTIQRANARLVASMPEFQRLRAVASSPIFGRPVDEDVGLLPVGRDPFSQAVLDTDGNPSRLTVPQLVADAYAVAVERRDFSLVGLACLARDAVMLAALRETMALYAGRSTFEGGPIPVYIWRVDDQVARQAARFVATFNRLFDEDLPEPVGENADVFFSAAEKNSINDRCVCIAETPPPVRYYHWAVGQRDRDTLEVMEFWDSEIVTTEKFWARFSEGRGTPTSY
jgi:hypothetical protein